MLHTICRVDEVKSVGTDIFILNLHAPEVASAIKAGQFINIKVHEMYQPLLRRPFSVYRAQEDHIEIIFNVAGQGTRILSSKKKNDLLDIIGPLGHPYTIDDSIETAILVGGGLGVAPFPLLTKALADAGKKIVTFLGARTRHQIIPQYLHDVHIATDDGSSGFHGTVVGLLDEYLRKASIGSVKIFGCGPNAMLRSLAGMAKKHSLSCEISMESAMACGIGLCQGCPIETINGPSKYGLICTAGPVFDAQSVRMV